MTEEKQTESVSAEEHLKLQQEVAQLREQSQKLQGTLANAEKSLEQYKGINPDEHFALKSSLEQLKQKQALQTPEDLEAYKLEVKQQVENQFKEQFGAEVKSLQEQLNAANKQNHQLTVVDKAMSSIGAAFNDDVHGFLKNEISRHIDKDASGNIIVKDQEGNQRFHANQTPYTLEDWSREFAERHPSMVKATVKAGAKQAGQVVNGATGFTMDQYLNNPEARARMSVADRRKFALEAVTNKKFTNN